MKYKPTPIMYSTGRSTWNSVTTAEFQLVVDVPTRVDMAIGVRIATSKNPIPAYMMSLALTAIVYFSTPFLFLHHTLPCDGISNQRHNADPDTYAQGVQETKHPWQTGTPSTTQSRPNTSRQSLHQKECALEPRLTAEYSGTLIRFQHKTGPCQIIRQINKPNISW